jgi:Lrp/AsnC family transcriptional regulator, leucine-responsive regulatory protein
MDVIDKKLLAILQGHAKTTNVELSRKSNLAPSSTLERVRRLEERGIVKGYRAVLDPIKLGYQLQAMVLITLSRHQVASIDRFEESIRVILEVVACYHLAGQYDYLVHLTVRDMEHLGDVIKHTIGGIQGVEKQETLLALSTVKPFEGYSLDLMPEDDA